MWGRGDAQHWFEGNRVKHGVDLHGLREIDAVGHWCHLK